MEIEEKKAEPKKSRLVSIIPLRDHVIKQNAFYYEFKKGVEIKVDERFIKTLQMEKVLNS